MTDLDDRIGKADAYESSLCEFKRIFNVKEETR